MSTCVHISLSFWPAATGYACLSFYVWDIMLQLLQRFMLRMWLSHPTSRQLDVVLLLIALHACSPVELTIDLQK